MPTALMDSFAPPTVGTTSMDPATAAAKHHQVLAAAGLTPPDSNPNDAGSDPGSGPEMMLTPDDSVPPDSATFTLLVQLDDSDNPTFLQEIGTISYPIQLGYEQLNISDVRRLPFPNRYAGQRGLL